MDSCSMVNQFWFWWPFAATILTHKVFVFFVDQFMLLYVKNMFFTAQLALMLVFQMQSHLSPFATFLFTVCTLISTSSTVSFLVDFKVWSLAQLRLFFQQFTMPFKKVTWHLNVSLFFCNFGSNEYGEPLASKRALHLTIARQGVVWRDSRGKCTQMNDHLCAFQANQWSDKPHQNNYQKK